MGVGSGRGSRARAKERRMREKQARKNAKRALYESMRGTARNIKDKTAGTAIAKPKPPRVDGLVPVRIRGELKQAIRRVHSGGPCGNVGCLKCSEAARKAV